MARRRTPPKIMTQLLDSRKFNMRQAKDELDHLSLLCLANRINHAFYLEKDGKVWILEEFDDPENTGIDGLV